MIGSAADIRVILATRLPCYTRDDNEDKFLFIATARDLERVALELWGALMSVGDNPPRSAAEALTPGWQERLVKAMSWEVDDNEEIPEM